MSEATTILFAGGGTGGHIYPNLAVVEELEREPKRWRSHFLVSERPVDAQILTSAKATFTALPARSLSKRPLTWMPFWKAYKASIAATQAIIQQTGAKVVVATGGFVSAPAAAAARLAGIPVVLVNLDAVPGRANRWLARSAQRVLTVYAHGTLARAEVIGLPLRQVAIGPDDVQTARVQLGLDPKRDVLFITGASQGARSLNQMMTGLAAMTQPRQLLLAWQVVHLTGHVDDLGPVTQAYQQAGITARVEVFSHQMGNMWRAASLAISRAGAGSVAEAWTNATPTIFMPYPYHRDQHQKHNAGPLVTAGAAIVVQDQVDPKENVRQIIGPLTALMTNESQRKRMVRWMTEHRPPNGAQRIAGVLGELVSG